MTLPEAESILNMAADAARVTVRKGTFVAVVDKLAQVDMGDSRFVCDFGSGYIPVVGETVRIWTVGDQHFLFPAGPRPTVGTVLTVSGSTVTVETTVGTFSCTYAGATPTSGDRVGLVWSEDGPWCSQKLSSTPAPPDPVPDPGTVTTRSATFRAVDVGSTDRHQARWWTDQAWASESTYGAWFYGTQIADTIPADASFVSLQFYASWQQRRFGAPRFVLHDRGFKNSIPNFSSYVEWAPNGGWQTPPGAQDWFNALKRGGGRLGVGLNQGGWNIFSSLAEDSMSGALRISWRS